MLDAGHHSARLVITRHADAAAFQSAASHFLIAAEAENNLILGIVDGLLDGRDVTAGLGSGEPPLLMTVGQAAVEMVAVRTPPQKLVISRGTEQAAKLLATALATHAIPGVRGEAATARAFAEAWAGETRQLPDIGRGSRVFELQTVRPPHSVSGQFRQASAARYRSSQPGTTR
jgi:hypothetical protein